ncbi:NAD-dependent epimerase/dehydratase family protein [Candidatus Microgenomates bacterium]|nr:MAG: NAD-dependent epimerase/dehydratase family protein [Candidatus Microgenomates bacterium]
MQNKYFQNKKILITGINGFVGSRLSKKLTDLGAIVFGISKVESSKRTLKSDILDFVSINKFVEDSKTQICFHLAGVSLVESGQEDPYNAFKVNLNGTLNILEIGRKNNFEKIIIASTSHVYGKNRVPYFEGYTPRPSRPYETSKACTDLIAQSYQNIFNLPVLIPRFVNIYGPGDLNFNRLIPKTIKSLLSDKEPIMWGGRAVRDYLYIEDAIEAYLSLASVDLKKIGNNRVFNFGGGNKISVKELIDKLINLSGKNLKIKKAKEERLEEIELQYVSFNKAINLLSWKPTISLDEGLKRSISWYQNYLKEI